MPIHCAPLVAHAREPTRSPTRSASISPTMAWHPMPPPTSVPGATLVLVLCGQPLQKNGARSTERAISATSADRRGQAAPGARRGGRRGAPAAA